MNGNYNVENGNTDVEWTCECGCRCVGIFDYDKLIGLNVIKDGFIQSVTIDDEGQSLELLEGGACPVCDGWEDGNGNDVRPEYFGEKEIQVVLVIETPRGLRQLDLDGYFEDDMWQAIDAYDEENGTHFWDLIEPEMIVPAYVHVDLPLPDLTEEDFKE